jgi:CRISPR/Cas system CSM-associated protein Csm3 (group 7 of RAMP superfamily)
MTAHHEKPRGVTERIHISGELILETPAHFGNGQTRGDALVDMTLLLDEAEPGRALIPGSTIAGALRNALRERLHGYYGTEAIEDKDSPIAWLFGPARESRNVTAQSLLIVDDALVTKGGQSMLAQGITLRDGVSIATDTGTAEEHKKFDMELLQAGTTFDLHFELALTEKQGARVLPYLATALQALEAGEIRLGARKRRGFGRCRVDSWTVSRYRLADSADLCRWLTTPDTAHRLDAKCGKIATALGITPSTIDRRDALTIGATFSLDRSSLLIRSGFGQADLGPDVEHLHTEDIHGNKRPVIPGTSWAGVVRHRALRIANTIARGDVAAAERAAGVVDGIFGFMPPGEEGGQASKVTVDETKVGGNATTDKLVAGPGETLYQTRVRIDRFTGGAFETALFEEAPVYGKRDTRVGFRLHVRQPELHEIGLLLLVLKDLWTGDLPVGGEASVGRGRLRGVDASINAPGGVTFTLRQGQAHLGLSEAQQATLQGYVDALWTKIQNSQEASDEAAHD